MGVINLMGLIDGTTWDTLAVLDITQGYVSGEIVMLSLPTMVRKLKGNIGSLSPAGSNPNVTPSVSLYVVTSML